MSFPASSPLYLGFDLDRLEGVSLSEILHIATAHELLSLSTDDIHRAYFEWAEKKGLNINSGIIGTPKYVADFMVRESVRIMKKRASRLSWYDPCCGSGIFIESILNHCRNESGFLSLNCLPSITAVELSPAGIFCAILVINKMLEYDGLSVSDYIASNKLNLILDDSLSLFEEQQSLIGKINTRFDVAIGNPPYVRANRLSPNQKEHLKQRFPFTYYGTADLYFYFISSAMSSLNDGGVTCFISPANFFRSTSAIPLRTSLSTRATLLRLIDLDELPVFHNADIHTAIYWLKNSIPNTKDKYFLYSHLVSINDLEKLKNSSIQYEKLHLNRITSSGWQFSRDDESKDISKYRHVISLKEAGFTIYSGIRPGLKNAFVHDESIASSLSEEMRYE